MVQAALGNRKPVGQTAAAVFLPTASVFLVGSITGAWLPSKTMPLKHCATGRMWRQKATSRTGSAPTAYVTVAGAAPALPAPNGLVTSRWLISNRFHTAILHWAS